MPTEAKKPQDRTKINILKAVGDILRKEGYPGLFVRNIARKANTSGKMIYYHFGTLDNLIETYIMERDYWRVFTEELDTNAEQILEQEPEDIVKALYLYHFEKFEQTEEMQKLMAWELSQHTDILRKEADLREAIGERVFKKLDPVFENSELDFRSVCALIAGGIYYLILHAKTNGSTFCGRDINQPEDREKMLKTIDQLFAMCFEKAKSGALAFNPATSS